jgi:polar amino acid transport system permease protein
LAMYDWDFKWVWDYRAQLLDGFLVTLRLNCVVVFLGTIAGIQVGLVSRHPFRAFRMAARAYVDLFRTLPVLVLLVWFFFCVPILAGGIRISGFWSAVVVLSLNLSAFIAEIVRAGVDAVPRNYVDDALAAGLTRWQTTRRVTLPIALRLMIPPLVGQIINTVKLSVLASIIAVPELLHRTTDIISQVYRPLEFYTALAVLFLLILLPGTLLSRRLETRAERMKSAGGSR